MNRAMIFPIHKKWVDMIFDGTKKFEFRNKLPKHLKTGMKIYIYETQHKVKTPYGFNVQKGQIVGEVTVGEIYDNNVVSELYDKAYYGCHSLDYYYEKVEELGYTGHKYAIELKNVIKYDEEWISENLSNLDYDWVEEPPMIKLLENSPTSPIAKEEFVSWNKYEKYRTYINNYNCNVIYPPQAPIYVVEKPYE